MTGIEPIAVIVIIIVAVRKVRISLKITSIRRG